MTTSDCGLQQPGGNCPRCGHSDYRHFVWRRDARDPAAYMTTACADCDGPRIGISRPGESWRIAYLHPEVFGNPLQVRHVASFEYAIGIARTLVDAGMPPVPLRDVLS